MVWRRRQAHGPSSRQHPSRRRTKTFLLMAAAGTVILYMVYFRLSLNSYLSLSLSPHYSHTTSATPQGDGTAVQAMVSLPMADLFLGTPPKWRDPKRDFEDEYLEVLEAVPELRSTRRARIAFFIMAHGPTDVEMLKKSLPWLYSPNNYILVHMDSKTADEDREEVRKLLDGLKNAKMLDPPMSVSWGGFSITLAALYGVSTMVEWGQDWDYFINLSASDFPLMTAVEMEAAMGTFVDGRVNFVTGSAMMEKNRAELYVDDQGLYRVNETRKASQPFLQRNAHLRVERPLPNLFTLFKGEFWVALHRDFCEYLHESPDNVARSLQAYFAKFRISDESYFQTTLCHPHTPEAFPVVNDNLRHVNWPQFDPETEWVLHPDPVESKHVAKLMNSGALFARKFEHGTSDEAWSDIETLLAAKGDAIAQRMARVMERAAAARTVQGREALCTVPEGYDLAYILRHQPVKKQHEEDGG